MTHLDPILTLSEDEQKNVHGGTNDTGTGQRVKEARVFGLLTVGLVLNNTVRLSPNLAVPAR